LKFQQANVSRTAILAGIGFCGLGKLRVAMASANFRPCDGKQGGNFRFAPDLVGAVSGIEATSFSQRFGCDRAPDPWRTTRYAPACWDPMIKSLVLMTKYQRPSRKFRSFEA
jgi:hypothetical protein